MTEFYHSSARTEALMTSARDQLDALAQDKSSPFSYAAGLVRGAMVALHDCSRQALPEKLYSVTFMLSEIRRESSARSPLREMARRLDAIQLCCQNQQSAAAQEQLAAFCRWAPGMLGSLNDTPAESGWSLLSLLRFPGKRGT